MPRSSTTHGSFYGSNETPAGNFAFKIVCVIDEEHEIEQIEKMKTNQEKKQMMYNQLKKAVCYPLSELCKDKEDKIIYAEYEDEALEIAGCLEGKWLGKKFMKDDAKFIVSQVEVDKIMEHDLENGTKVESWSDLENSINNFNFTSNNKER